MTVSTSERSSFAIEEHLHAIRALARAIEMIGRGDSVDDDDDRIALRYVAEQIQEHRDALSDMLSSDRTSCAEVQS